MTMPIDALLTEIAGLGWRLRYLQQEPRHWAAMLYHGHLSTPRAIGYTPSEALANAIELIGEATEFQLTDYIPPTRINLRDLVNLPSQQYNGADFDL